MIMDYEHTRTILKCVKFQVSIPDTGVKSRAISTYSRALAWAEENTPMGSRFFIRGADDVDSEVRGSYSWSVASGVC